jgi:gluconate kinase
MKPVEIESHKNTTFAFTAGVTSDLTKKYRIKMIEGGKVHSVKPLERHAFGGPWTDERERWEGE